MQTVQINHSYLKHISVNDLPSLSNWILAPLYFQRTVGGGELMTSHTIMALSPSVNSWGDGTFVKVIFSGGEKQQQFSRNFNLSCNHSLFLCIVVVYSRKTSHHLKWSLLRSIFKGCFVHSHFCSWIFSYFLLQPGSEMISFIKRQSWTLLRFLPS